MSNISIFQQKSTAVAGREVSELSKALADSGGGSTTRRITMAKGVFRRIVNGKEAGRVKDGFLNAIIINALPKVLLGPVAVTVNGFFVMLATFKLG